MKKISNLSTGMKLLLASVLLVAFSVVAYFYPVAGVAAAGVGFFGLTTEEETAQKALLDTIEKQVKEVMAKSQNEGVKKEDIDKMVLNLNKQINDLNETSIKNLKERMDKLAQTNEALQAEVNSATEALKVQGTELGKLKDNGAATKEEKLSFRDAIKNAILEKKDQILTEKNDDNGKRLSLKDYFTEKGNKQTPVFTIKAVDMFESNIVQSNVQNLRLTELDANRVGIPLAIYPHVFDFMKSKTISRPYMSLLVVYDYQDGTATKPEGTASSKSSFLFKTVEFKAFFIATHFVMSDETLDDLEEALDEITTVAPDKIMDKIDGKIIRAGGDDSSDIKGILHSDKSTAFDNPLSAGIADAYIVDVIAAAKQQVLNNRYRPNVVLLNPEMIVQMAAKKNTFEDSKSDRRVSYNNLGEPVAVCGLAIVQNQEMGSNALVIMDNAQPWIGKRKDMTMEIGYNGTDLTEGQKTVVFKTRIAFGVRDKAAVVYVADVNTAITNVGLGS